MIFDPARRLLPPPPDSTNTSRWFALGERDVCLGRCEPGMLRPGIVRMRGSNCLTPRRMLPEKYFFSCLFCFLNDGAP